MKSQAQGAVGGNGRSGALDGGSAAAAVISTTTGDNRAGGVIDIAPGGAGPRTGTASSLGSTEDDVFGDPFRL